MPTDNIQRAISKASDKSSQLEELHIETLGPGGVALKIKAITDSKNRAISDIKAILSEHGSKMVPPGSISWMFNQPLISVSDQVQQEVDKLLEALDSNDDVEDVTSNLKE